MSALATRISEPDYYYREYNNDIPTNEQEAQENSWTYQCKRIATVALPYVSLYKPLSLPLSFTMGSVRVVSSVFEGIETVQENDRAAVAWAILQITIAVISLAGTIFAHPMGMFITTGHDLVIETGKLLQHLHSGDLNQALENCLNIINNSLYLALFLQGGLELGIASLAVQILTGIYHSLDELNKGHYLEAAGHAGMSVVRGNQLHEQIKLLQLQVEIEAALSKIAEQVALKSSPLRPDVKGPEEQHLEGPEGISGETDLDHAGEQAKTGMMFRKIQSSSSNQAQLKVQPAGEDIPKAASMPSKTIISSMPADCSDNRSSIPEEVLMIYRRQRGQTLNQILKNGHFNDALLLLRHHLYRPDEMGMCCKAAAGGGSLELVQLCLPDRQYLIENPSYLDELLRFALQSVSTKPDVLSFLSCRDAVLNCPERDSYFKDWFDHEMRFYGAKTEEWFEDFIKRKGLGSAEKTQLISKFPLEVKRVFGSFFNAHISLNYFLHSNNLNLENALIIIKYSIAKPTCFSNFNQQSGSMGSFEHLLYYGSHDLAERERYLFKEIWKKTIPSLEYRQAHLNELNNLYNYWAESAIRYHTHSSSDTAVEILKNLVREGVDLQQVAATTRYPWAREYLKKRGFVP